MSRFAKLRQSIQEKKQQSDKKFDNNFYPFWQANVGQEIVVRFLPDSDQSNENVVYIEKAHHEIELNGKTKKIPCLSMYGDDCPICQVSQDYYKAKDDERGKYYWKKLNYMARVIVVSDPLPPQDNGETFEGKVCITSFNKDMVKKIDSDMVHSFDDTDPEPWSVEEGFNYTIRPIQGSKKEYKDYTTSSGFDRKPSAVDVSGIEDFEEEYDFQNFIPKKPDIDKVQAMLDAHLNGEEYVDPDEKGDGGEEESSSKSKPAESSVVNHKVDNFDDDDDDDDMDDVVIESDDDDDEEDALMRKIRERRTG